MMLWHVVYLVFLSVSVSSALPLFLLLDLRLLVVILRTHCEPFLVRFENAKNLPKLSRARVLASSLPKSFVCVNCQKEILVSSSLWPCNKFCELSICCGCCSECLMPNTFGQQQQQQKTPKQQQLKRKQTRQTEIRAEQQKNALICNWELKWNIVFSISYKDDAEAKVNGGDWEETRRN